MKSKITIVAGFGRCGSSLVMQMLAAGGMPTPYSEFPSYEITQKTNIPIPILYGGAIKVLDPHINRPPVGPEYRFIWLDRDVVEQARSMAKFWRAIMAESPPGMPTFPEITEKQLPKLAEAFRRDRPRCSALMLKYVQCHAILKLRFEDILADPAGTAKKLNRFCGGGLDEEAMVAQVRPREPGCLPYMLELEQLREVKASWKSHTEPPNSHPAGRGDIA